MSLKQTIALRAFGFLKIPLLFLVRPSVVKATDKECEVRIPLNLLTRNHVKSMYFGALSIGADCAGGLIAMEAIRKSGKKVSLLFKDFKADFLRRAEGDVHFICKDGSEIRRQVEEAIKTKKRINRTLSIVATTPKVSKNEPVAKFLLTLSLKAQ